MEIIIITYSEDGLTPEIDIFFTNEKAVKHLGTILDEYPIKPDPETDFKQYLEDYQTWVREENDNMCEVAVNYKVIKIK